MVVALRSHRYAICFSFPLVIRVGVSNSGNSRRPATVAALAFLHYKEEGPAWWEEPQLELETDAAFRLEAHSTEPMCTPS